MKQASIFETVLHPNHLTVLRMLMVPLLIVLMLFDPTPLMSFITALIFAVASLTDMLDGMIARKYNLITTFGKIMDPLADKLIVASAMIMLIPQGRLAAWIVCLIIAREFAVTGLRSAMLDKKMDVAASNLGKFKTIFQLVGVLCLLVHYTYVGVSFHAVGTVLIYIALFFTLWSGLDYFYRFKKAL